MECGRITVGKWGELLMADYLVTDTELISIADAIRTKGGTSADLSFPTEFVSAINAISAGGLEYETGTWTPTADTERGTINFAKSHTEAPILVVLADVDETPISTSNSNHSFMYFDYYKLWGHGIPYTANGFRFASVTYNYRGTSTTQITTGGVVLSQNSDSTSDASASYPRYWVKPNCFYPYTYNASRYWRANRTYKWLAIWK